MNPSLSGKEKGILARNEHPDAATEMALRASERDLREKVYAALDEYANAHAKLSTYNKAQKLAQTAAVSLGRRRFKETISALTELDNHLQNREDWIKFAHEGLDV